MSDKQKQKDDALEWDLQDRDRHLREGVLRPDAEAVVHTTVLVEADK